MTYAIQPTENRILVKRVESSDKTPGGIIIPDTAKEKPMEGVVVAVGPGRRGENGTINPVFLKVGQKVLFAKWSGTEIEKGKEKLVLMKEEDVLAIVASDKKDCKDYIDRFIKGECCNGECYCCPCDGSK